MTEFIFCLVSRPFTTSQLNDVARLFNGVTYTCKTPIVLHDIEKKYKFTSKKISFSLIFCKKEGYWTMMTTIPMIFKEICVNDGEIYKKLFDYYSECALEPKDILSTQPDTEDDEDVFNFFEMEHLSVVDEDQLTEIANEDKKSSRENVSEQEE
jgi:hypothetical protein